MTGPSNSIAMVGGQGKHDEITMGGMFTVFKVRERLKNYSDPGWYDAPTSTQAMTATAEDLRRDGIDVDQVPKPIEGEGLT
jgi:manganese oxidase